MGNPFTYVNSINNKEYIFDDKFSNEYDTFMVQMAFSYFPDTVLLANELNRNQGIPVKSQYDFLYHSVSKRKRFGKWTKKEATSENLKLVMDYFKFSAQKANEALNILSDEQIEEIRQIMNVGGKS